MRLGVIVLFLAIAVVMASPPAIAQSSEAPAAEKAAEKAAKEAEKAAKKAAKEAEKAAKKAQKAAEKAAKEAEKAAEKAAKKAAKEAEKATKKAGKEKDAPGGAEEGGGDDDEGEEGNGGGAEGGGGTRQPGDSGSGGGRDTGGGDTGSGGQASGDGESSTMGLRSPVTVGQSPSVGERGCRQACSPPNARTAGDEEVGDLAATGGPSGLETDVASLAAVEDEGQFEEGLFALSQATPAGGNSGAFALLTLATVVLLVGLGGGLRAALSSAGDLDTRNASPTGAELTLVAPAAVEGRQTMGERARSPGEAKASAPEPNLPAPHDAQTRAKGAPSVRSSV
jgi:hypothetical protein